MGVGSLPHPSPERGEVGLTPTGSRLGGGVLRPAAGFMPQRSRTPFRPFSLAVESPLAVGPHCGPLGSIPIKGKE